MQEMQLVEHEDMKTLIMGPGDIDHIDLKTLVTKTRR